MSSSSDSDSTPAPAAPDRLTGQVIGGYRVGERLGGGAHSTVYRAEHVESGRAVAIKLLLPGADGVTRARFRHEARTALELDHPHIIKTLDVGQLADDDVAYIVMELVDGVSLGALLERTPQLSVLEASGILAPIAAALAYAHQHNIVHRDVKPSNILLQSVAPDTPGAVQVAALEDPVIPLLTDFGIARALDAPELTSAGRTIGTPAYMAPEQCEGEREADGRADLYSLGAVLYRMLVGRAPFGGSATQVLYAHVYRPLTIPDTVLVELPVNVINILRRSLAKAPQDRYGSAEEMAADLGQITGRYAAMRRATGVTPDEVTRTMSSLPATRPQSDSYSVLVPAVKRRTVSASGGVGAPPSREVPASSRGSLPAPLLAAGIVAAAMLIVMAVSIPLLRTPRQDEIAQTDAPTSAPGQNAALASAATITETILPGPEATAAPQADGADEHQLAPAVIPEPAMIIPGTWNDIRQAYIARDWEVVHDSIRFLLRADPRFNARSPANLESEAALIRAFFRDDPNAEFWAAVDEAYADRDEESFNADDLQATIFDMYVGSGTIMNRRNLFDQAIAYFEAALTLEPDAEQIQALLQAAKTYEGAELADRLEARSNLAQAHLAYAATLTARGEECAAFEQLSTANSLESTSELVVQLAAMEARCAHEQIAVAENGDAPQFAGTLIYNSRSEDRDRIFAIDMTAPESSGLNPALLAEDAIFGMPSPQGDRLVIYSTRINEQGLYDFPLDQGLAPGARGTRYPGFTEDGAASPPSWSPEGDRLVFASQRVGDGSARIYIMRTDGGSEARHVGDGRDVAWHPMFNSVIYNGVDDTGNRPGLWMVDDEGAAPQRLTTVESDRRPQWSPGGQYIVFTSKDRDGNWEIYRRDTVAGDTERMTNHPANDVLPTVSPNSSMLAFLSDRSGSWRIWVMPLEGGDPVIIAPVQGQIGSWEETSLKWAP
ncbi:MAG: protein kinase [Caldilineaceae bacterium]|nr:protein kinase [Caldilineaceae bacterium]